MAKPSQEDRVNRWTERITTANKVYDRWAKKYRCDVLQEYYCGEQWAGYSAPSAQPDHQPYTVNLVFSNIETQQPTLYFYRPTVKVEPRPPFSDDPLSRVAERAKLCEDTIQTFIDKPSVHFKLQTLLGLRDANYRFGLVEVGYTADWIDNPHVGKPVLKEGTKDEALKGEDGEDVLQPDLIPKSEDLFVKRIDPSTFRVSVSDKHALEDNDWVGYFEWHYVEDLKRNRKYKNTADLKPSGTMKDESQPVSDEEREKRAGMVKVWKIWDLRQRKRFVLADGHKKFLLDGEPWSHLPFAVLKFYETTGFYPLPPVFNWISPQDSVNEVREARRTHRRRFNRRYTVMNGGIDDPELEKLESGGDGVYAKRNTQEDPIKAVEDAPLGADFDKDLVESKDDFQQVSGVGAEARGDAESETATQANIIDVRMRIRESAGRATVAEWLSQICRLILLTVREKMHLPLWIQMHADPTAPDPNEWLRIAQSWQEITPGQLGADELDVKVDITSLSPVSQDAQRVAWNEVLALITNPSLAMVLAMSEPLLRKTLKFYGITSEAEIQEIAMVLKNMLMMQVAAQQAQADAAAATPKGKPAGPPAGVPASGPSVVQ